MGLFDIFKKREVPSELPSLSLDRSMPNFSPTQGVNKREIASQMQNMGSLSQKSIFRESDNSSKYKPLPVQKVEVWNSAHESKPKAENNIYENEKGFFKELIKDLTNEINSEKLDDNYKEKILKDDIVTQMKSYWEKQKPEVFLQNAGKEIKDQLMKKAENLNELEKDWQGAYFSLIAKEERIRQEEKELKQMLSELMGIYEKSLSRRSISANNDNKEVPNS